MIDEALIFVGGCFLLAALFWFLFCEFIGFLYECSGELYLDDFDYLDSLDDLAKGKQVLTNLIEHYEELREYDNIHN